MDRIRGAGWIGAAAMTALLAGCALTGGGECTVTVDGWVDAQLWGPDPGQTSDRVSVSAPVTVIVAQQVTAAGDRTPATVELDDGSRVRVRYRLPGDDALVLVPGQRLWAELSGRSYFWGSYQIALFEVDAGGGPGGLLLSVWSSDGDTATAPGWTLGHQDSDCTIADDSCGHLVGRDLRVTSPGGGAAVLAPGRSTDLDGYRVSNGDSRRYDPGPECTDTPLGYAVGGLVRLAGA